MSFDARTAGNGASAAAGKTPGGETNAECGMRNAERLGGASAAAGETFRTPAREAAKEPPTKSRADEWAYRTPIPEAVEEYLRLVESDTPRACPEQHALCAYIRRVFRDEELIVEEERLAKYLSLEKYFPFALFPWEKFLTALWLCVYRAPGIPRWKTLFCLVGRGAGKDGFIAFAAFALVSPYNPVKGYDVDICANDEEQATRPVKDTIDVLETPKSMSKLNRFYYHTKELFQGRANRGVVKGRTNNPKHRDGMRSGMIVFNEIHAYQNYDNIKVFRTGMGKKAEPREGAFSSNGEISDGPLDDYIERGRRVLFQNEEDQGFLPFICCLPNEEAVHDPENWTMANPSLQYNPTLRQEIEDEYREWRERPEEHGDFLTKRMGLRKGYKEITVTDYANIKATNRPLPDLSGWSCTVGIDFAELSDFASVNAHFRRGNERFDLNRTWICAKSKTLGRVKAPFRDWAGMTIGGAGERIATAAAGGLAMTAAEVRQTLRGDLSVGKADNSPYAGEPGASGEAPKAGEARRDAGIMAAAIVTVVEDVSIHPRLLAEWVRELGQVYNIQMLALDAFRWTVVSDALRQVGFDAEDKTRVKLIRPSDVMKADTVIQELFTRQLLTWGDNPCLRWAVNNTKRLRRGRAEGADTGNYYYAKIDAKARKTDPFMAFVASMAVEERLGTGEAAELPKMGAVAF